MPQETAEQPKPHVYTDEHPEYPKMVYNHETRQTKAATDKKHEEELGKHGYETKPYPPEEPDALTDQEIADLQKLLAKAAQALAKLGKLSQKHESDNAKSAPKKS